MTDQTAPKSQGLHKKWWFWVIAVFIAILLLASAGGSNATHTQQNIPSQTNTSPAPQASAPVQASSATWHQAYTYSDSGKVETPLFTLKGSQQRITYSCMVTDSTHANVAEFDGFILTPPGNGGDHFAMLLNCPTNKATYAHDLAPGQYYLSLNAIYAKYSVTVEDYY